MTGGRTNPKQDATEAFRNNEFAAYGPLTRHEQGGQRPHGARACGVSVPEHAGDPRANRGQPGLTGDPLRGANPGG